MNEPSRPLSFETFSAIRRRQQSLKETNAINTVASSMGINTTTIPPATLAELSNDVFKDTFYSSFTTLKIYLILVFIDVLCVIFALVYALYHDDVVSVLSSHHNPTMPKLILPTFEFLHTVLGYLGYIISIISIGEMGIYIFALWESRIIWSWLRIIDGIVVLILLTVRSLPGTIPVVELLVLLRIVRVMDVLQMVTNELVNRTTRYETQYLEERNRSELYQSQMEQMQSKLQDEIKYRNQAESLAQTLANRNERLTVALVIAANEVSQVVGPETAQNIVNYPDDEEKKENMYAYGEKLGKTSTIPTTTTTMTKPWDSTVATSSSTVSTPPPPPRTETNDDDFEDASSLDDEIHMNSNINNMIESMNNQSIVTERLRRFPDSSSRMYDNSSIGSRKSKDSETKYSDKTNRTTGKSTRLSIQKNGAAVLNRV